MASDPSVNYFAYGTPRDPEMMAAIIGRQPNGEPATLRDYHMTIQRGLAIPENVRHILASNWTASEVKGFETYAIAPKAGELVVGTVWKLTPDERELVDNWELNDGLWYRKMDVTVQAATGDVMATTETITSGTLPDARRTHPDLPLYLMDKRRMLEIAVKVRRNYLASEK